MPNYLCKNVPEPLYCPMLTICYMYNVPILFIVDKFIHEVEHLKSAFLPSAKTLQPFRLEDIYANAYSNAFI